MVPARYRLTPLETCVGSPYGADPLAPALPPPLDSTARAALERAVLESLSRPPCLVTFSGGRDSSTMLALALRLARERGLEDPIAITHRFPESPESDESDWQELVVAHLGVTEWEKLSWTDELDLVGPYGGAVLRRHGLVMPFNSHFVVPFLERARGGSLLTGIGGDELFGPVDRPLLARMLFERRMPRRRHARALAGEMAPRIVRERRALRDHPFEKFEWLRPPTYEQLAPEYVRTYSMPLRWDDSIDHMWRSRYLQCERATMAALAADHDAVLDAPFFDPQVLSSFAAAAGAAGLGKRAASLPALVGDVIPERLAQRTTKASFDPVFFGRHTREFVDSWDGSGVDPDLVDPDALAREWRRERPRANTFSLLQQAWLETDAAHPPADPASDPADRDPAAG